MSNAELNKYGRYLASLMGSTINNTSPQEPFEGINWAQLYSLASLHNVTSLIYPSLTKLNLPEDIFEKFTYDNNRLKAREARQEIEAQRVFKALNQIGIEFIKLKGIVIKNFYPMPYMRTSADVDICMSKEDRERSRAVMKDLGYTLDANIDYNDEYSKDDFFIYELHSSVISSKSPYAQLFSEPSSKAVKDSDGINFILNTEYFYMHLVIHLLTHFMSGGCGIRQLCDLYVFEKTHPKLDMDYVSTTLGSYELTQFFNTMRKLSVSLFEQKELTSDEEEIASFIFSSGEYGNGNLKHISWLSDDKNITWTFSKKCNYFLKLWFPGVSTMKKRYPVLEKAPFLLPVCWVRRIFYTIFFKRSSFREQRDEIKRLNSDELKEAKHVRNLAGLK